VLQSYIFIVLKVVVMYFLLESYCHSFS